MVRENNDSLTSYQYFDDSRIETDKLFLFTYQFSNFSGLILILTIINMIQKTTRKSIKIIPFFLELNNFKIYTVTPIFYEFSQILEFFRCCCSFSSNISSTSNMYAHLNKNYTRRSIDFRSMLFSSSFSIGEFSFSQKSIEWPVYNRFYSFEKWARSNCYMMFLLEKLKMD